MDLIDVSIPFDDKSPSAQAKQMRRLLAFHEKLVTEKGAPRSRLMGLVQE